MHASAEVEFEDTVGWLVGEEHSDVAVIMEMVAATRLDVADTVQAMDDAEIDIALLSAWYGPDGPLVSNDEVDAQIAEAPDRFRGLASVDLRRPAEAVATIREWVDGERFVGVRVVPWLWDLPPNDRRYYPVYVACIEAGVPFCTSRHPKVRFDPDLRQRRAGGREPPEVCPRGSTPRVVSHRSPCPVPSTSPSAGRP